LLSTSNHIAKRVVFFIQQDLATDCIRLRRTFGEQAADKFHLRLHFFPPLFFISLKAEFTGGSTLLTTGCILVLAKQKKLLILQDPQPIYHPGQKGCYITEK
jgi:hypothetical protein